MKTLFFALILIVQTWAVFARADDYDFKSFSGQIEFFQSLFGRHSNIGMNNLRYQRPFIEALKTLMIKQELLLLAQKPLNQNEVLRISGRYSLKPALYNESLVSSFRAGLIEDLQVLSSSHLLNLRLPFLAQAVSFRQIQDKKIMRTRTQAFLRLAPLLYSVDGKSVNFATVSEVEIGIRSTPVPQLEVLYRDHWAKGLGLLLKSEAEKNRDQLMLTELNSHTRVFSQGIIPQLVKPTSSDSETRTLSLEEVPLGVALYRGYFGGDCSILSVPFYILFPEVQVFFLRKSGGFDARVDGYALVLDTEHEGRTLPFILTINGAALQEADVAATVHMIAHAKQTEFVLLPDHQLSHGFLVNTSAAVRGTTATHAIKTPVNLPDGWEKASAPQVGYPDYYKVDHIKQAYLANVHNLRVPVVYGIKINSVANPYKDVKKTSAPLKERAVFAANLARNIRRGQDLEVLLRKFDLTAKQLATAKLLQGSQTLNLAQFREVESVLGIELGDLAKFETERRLRTLARLGQESPELRESELWRLSIQRASAVLDRETAYSLKTVPANAKIEYFIKLKRLVPPELRQYSRDVLIVVEKLSPQLRLDQVEVLSEVAPYSEYSFDNWIANLKDQRAHFLAFVLENPNHILGVRYREMAEDWALDLTAKGSPLTEEIMRALPNFLLTQPQFADRYINIRMEQILSLPNDPNSFMDYPVLLVVLAQRRDAQLYSFVDRLANLPNGQIMSLYEYVRVLSYSKREVLAAIRLVRGNMNRNFQKIFSDAQESARQDLLVNGRPQAEVALDHSLFSALRISALTGEPIICRKVILGTK